MRPPPSGFEGKSVNFRTDSLPVLEHPAARAWERLGSGRAPARVEVLTNRKGHHLNHKSRVYRLTSAGPGSAVIAKRTGRETVELERVVYQDILGALPVAAVKCFGGWDDGDEAWLFLEEVSGAAFDEERAAHRQLAAEWLGAVHAATSGMRELRDRLPHHGSDRYLALLHAGLRSIEVGRENAGLTADERSALTTVQGELARTERDWPTLAERCATMPHCLVHGDFIAKNVRIRDELLFALDWEEAGWGVPAEDLGALDQTIADVGGCDLDAYYARVRDAWPNFDRGAAAELRGIGIMLRYICWIQAESVALRSQWPGPTVELLTVYGQRLRRARELAGIA